MRTTALGIADSIGARLSPLASRDVLAFAAVMLTVAGMSGGLFYYASWLQIGIVAGALTATISGRLSRAVVVAAVAAAAGLLLGPVSAWTPALTFGDRFLHISLAAATAGACAALFMIPDVRRVANGRVLVWMCVALILGNLCATTLTLNANPTMSAITGQLDPSFNDQLNGALPAGSETSDNVLFFNIYRDVRAGEPYHASFRTRLLEWGGNEPRTILNYRMPYLFYVWSVMPIPQAIVWLYLGLTSVAAASLTVLFSDHVKRPLVVPTVAAIASFAIYSTTSLLLFSMEPWSVMPALGALGLTAASFARDRWKGYVVGAVATAVVAVLFRETMALIMVAVFASAVLSDPEQRRFRLGAWAAGLAVLAGAYAVHYAKAEPLLKPSSELAQFISGGVSFALRGLVYATDYLGLGGPLPWVLVALGFLGAALAPGRALKAYTLVATIAPLVAFAVFANYAREHHTGEALNYWGAVLTPVLYASMSFAFLLLPGAGVRPQSEAAPNRSPKADAARRRRA